MRREKQHGRKKRKCEVYPKAIFFIISKLITLICGQSVATLTRLKREITSARPFLVEAI